MSYIADVASLPEWISVKRLFDFMSGVHPGFSRDRAMQFLARTEVTLGHKVKALSKGMKTQLHLSLIMGVDSQLLILDEPTLGLDIIFRTDFYDTLRNEYFNQQRSILVTTHQVEEIERYLTRVMFIHHGRILFDMPTDDIAGKFARLTVEASGLERAGQLRPLYSRPAGEKHVLIYEDPEIEPLQRLGLVDTPGLADLFVAKVKGVNHE
jgi:ABC-2 type transport system ATP-binding protein